MEENIKKTLIDYTRELVSNPLFPDIEDVEQYVEEHLKRSNRIIMGELDKIKPDISKIRSKAVVDKQYHLNELNKCHELIKWCDKQ